MEPDWTLPGVSKTDIGSHEAIRPRRGVWTGRLLAIAASLVAIAAIGAILWIYADVKREILRMSTDIAQIRVSLDLYSRQQPQAAASATSTPSTTQPAAASGELLDLKNRIAILENAWRKTGSTGASTTAALPALPGAAATAATPAKTTAGGAQNDCLPQDTRFLVTGGDKYPVCGTKGTIAVAAVGDSEVTFADGSSIAAGGSSDLKGTQCTLTVISAGADGMAGYAEVRVGC